MRTETIPAPVALLLNPDLTVADKVLWLALRLNAGVAPPTRLAASSGLTLATIRSSLPRLEAAGWHSSSGGATNHSPSQTEVFIPAALLAESGVRHLAKLVYGLLQTLPGFCENAGTFTYTALSAHLQVSVVTARAVVRELAASGWIHATQAGQKAPVRFSLRIPEQDRSALEVSLVAQRLQDSDHRGEAIMQEYLSLLIDLDEFEDNARPGFLINPLTDQPMELDRYYPKIAAFEFNGDQHRRTTKRFPSGRALANQQARDLMKEAQCARRGVQLIVIEPADLSLEAIRAKVGSLRPQRDLRPHGDLIKYLEKVSKSYRQGHKKRQQQAAAGG